ncbi:MAG: helix-turn-helix transcriptional regulator [Bacteriovoracaceae bacterium]
MKKKSRLSDIVREKRKEIGLTQEDLALRSGVGIRFIRDLEQGKATLRLDKVNDVLGYFGLEVGVTKLRKEDE